MACFSQNCNNCDDTLVCWFVSDSESIDIAKTVDGYYSQGFDGCRALISVNGLPSSAMSQYLETSHNFTGSTALDSIQNGGTYEGYGNGDICNSCSSYDEYIQGAHIVEYGLRRMVPEGEDDTSESSQYTATTILEDSMSGLNDLVQVYIPSSVTKIKNGAFSGCSNLNTLIVGTNTKSIGNSAFENCGIENIDWGCCGSKTLTLGNAAFKNCDNLKELNIEDCIKSCGSDCFASCNSLSSVTIGNGLSRLSVRMFSACTSLESIDIPDNIVQIGESAFRGCSSLASVTIPSSVKNMDGYAFANCYGLQSAEIIGNGLILRAGLFNGCTSLTSVTIGSGVTAVGISPGPAPESVLGPFSMCYRLSSIDIPDNVTFIGSNLFFQDEALTSVTIGSGVTLRSSFNFNAFSGTTNLREITINSEGGLYGQLSGKTSLEKLTIGDVPTKIGYEAFKNCYSLTSVTIGNGVKSIDDYAFYNCSGLTSVRIGNGLESIGVEAFRLCDALITIGPQGSGASLELPSSLKKIGDYAFFSCNGLTDIILPEGLTTIGNTSFSSCRSLTSITISSTVTSIGENFLGSRVPMPVIDVTCLAIIPPSLGNNAFQRITTLQHIYVPSGSVDAYKSAENWRDFANLITSLN